MWRGVSISHNHNSNLNYIVFNAPAVNSVVNINSLDDDDFAQYVMAISAYIKSDIAYCC